VFAWYGSGSSDIEKTTCKTACGVIFAGTPAVDVQEGSESDEFWAALGGKAEYANFKDLGINPDFEARLFDMRNSTANKGAFWMEEVHNFN